MVSTMSTPQLLKALASLVIVSMDTVTFSCYFLLPRIALHTPIDPYSQIHPDPLSFNPSLVSDQSHSLNELH